MMWTEKAGVNEYFAKIDNILTSGHQGCLELSSEIVALAGLTDELLEAERLHISNALASLLVISEWDVVRYDFINQKLCGDKSVIKSKKTDLLKLVKREKMVLKPCRSEDALLAYGIGQEAAHRALRDVYLMHASSAQGV
ncbi:MAG: hypothetical protein GX030_05870 [Firmicutes bacterium]|nr:hypothetical protein [Bacillota bacterium]